MSFFNIHEAREHVQAFKQDLLDALPTMREFNDALTMSIALSRKFGIAGPIMEVIAMFQRARLAAEMFIRSIQLFYAVSGPIGWALALGGIILGGLSMVDMMEMRRPHY